MRVDLILFEPFFYHLNHFDKLILHTWLHPRNYCLSTEHIHTEVILGKEWSMYSSYKPHYTKFTLNVPNKSIWNKVVVSCYPRNWEENNTIHLTNIVYMKQTNKLHYEYVETNKVYGDNENNIYLFFHFHGIRI